MVIVFASLALFFMYIKRSLKYVNKKLASQNMHLAILMTNTDESDFAQQHPKDGEKFAALIHSVRPNWTCKVYRVKDGEFPASLDGIDGFMITGSPSSTQGDAPWIAELLQLIRQNYDQNIPQFGACFGHQAIAMALGGTIGRSPAGWVHGTTHNTLVHKTPWMADLPDIVKLYGSHVEQVTQAPNGARVLASSEGTPIAGIALGDRVYTTQHHPEMTPEFIAALTEELADDMGEAVATTARASLAERADTKAYAESIARFFEMPR